MNWMKRFSRRSFWWILFWNTLLCAAVLVPAWIGLDILMGLGGEVAKIQPEANASARLAELLGFLEGFRLYAVGVIYAVFFLFSLILWLCVRGSAKKAALVAAEPKKVEKPKDETDEKSARQKAMDDQRRALLLFSLLQREGRLMDFFAEDLSLYEDDQIGAAARGVQESCKKLIEKHFNPMPVLDHEEGGPIIVEDNFDPAAIKLIGNVSGKPPFKGILRHRGWRAGRFEMPTLIAQGDPRLISPAEVEIE
ncbi:MAG: DUF2760 domain-containing protein [Desulfatibacillum sp.]|nr:DUF2760 domain-containing protein [Desulfatibacillum sp.]